MTPKPIRIRPLPTRRKTTPPRKKTWADLLHDPTAG